MSEAAAAPTGADLVAELHRRQRAMYAGGPVEPVVELLDEQVVWHVPGRSAIAGDHRGRAGVLRYFELRRGLASNKMQMHPRGVLVEGDAVAQMVDGTAELEGEPVHWRTVGVYRIKAGRVAEVWLVPLDLEQFDRIWSALGAERR